MALKIYVFIEDRNGNIDIWTYSTKEKAQEAFVETFSRWAEEEEEDDFYRNADAAAEIGYACFGNCSIRIEESELDRD